MGMVCRAWDERLQRSVAIKHFRTDSEFPELRQRSWREAQTAARLNHPAIVHVYDLVEEAGGAWIVMELVEGETLRNRITAEGRLSVAQVLRLGLDIAEGVAEAHSHGVLHRDLKASNVMVTPAGHAKVLDFGLAKQLSSAQGAEEQDLSLSTPGTVVGTSYAMSPEQVLGRPLDDRSDLFSLGSLLYEMLTGEPPFRAATVQASMAAVLSLRPPPLAAACQGVPQGLSDLVNRLLEKDSRLRPQSAREVAQMLASLAGTSTHEDSLSATVPELTPFRGADPRSGGGEPSGSTSVPARSAWWRWGAGLVLLTGALTVSFWFPPRFLASHPPPFKPNRYVLHIQVLDPNGRPVTRARIHSSVGTPKLLASGEWGVALPAAKVPSDGLVSLSAEHDDWEGSQREVALGADPNPRIRISLKVPESWIRGQAVDSNNHPLSGVRISRQDGAPGEASTDAQGRFTFKLAVRTDTLIRLRSEREGWQPGDDFCYAGRATCSILLEKKR
jgi:serine/threonine-protein kinase